MITKNSSENIKPLIKKIKSNIDVICCSGTKDSSGHPAVYYNFGKKKEITCQYCGTIFLKTE